MARTPLYRSEIPGYPVYRGKVRDVYDLGTELLIVATDRLSAFDVVFPDPIPDKGIILTQLSLWWFERTRHLTPNHVVATDVADFPAALAPWRNQLRGRAMIGRKTTPLKAEFIVRGYLDGSAWKDYQAHGSVCGIRLLAGLRRRSPFGAPLFTPTTKADAGHDEPISPQELANQLGRDVVEQAARVATALYTEAHNRVLDRGLVLSDTKFEFGLTPAGELILIDEILTPDSSRYWIRESYTTDPEAEPISLDKQYLRDHVERIGWSKTPPAPSLPPEVIAQTRARYLQAYAMVTGTELAFD
jgi:phosphoribosylaminoimidazole-succinocarboxamide synthase